MSSDPGNIPPTETSSGAPEGTERLILDIPSTVMLQDSNVAYWVERYRQYARRTPTEICLPAIVRSGPAFESIVQPPQASLGSVDPLGQWVAEAREALGPDVTIWGRVLLHFGFTASEFLFIRDQYNEPGEQICITNKIARQIVAKMVTEVLDHGVDGIVLDAVNILPSAGSSLLGDNEISVSCFCDHCVSGLRERGFRVKWSDFTGPRNRMRIVLHNTATGTDHIDPTHETIRTRDHERLLSHARARKFLAPDEEWREEAISLIQYLEARGRLVWESFRALTEPCKGRAKSAVILGSVDYDQSQQVTAAMMANSGAVDEIWVPDAKIGTPEDSSLLCYLASRSSYYANALFATLERANELIVAFGIEEFLEVLLSQSKAWSSANKLSPASVYSSSISPQYRGNVSIPLFQHEHRKLVEDATLRLTGSVLPERLLEQFRIAAGPASLAP
ncbi:hypothetical protein [Streptomyces melanogenes]|uniref:Uncharacterized protein n=1 Tax=Streptomyces melanogenes TaxID=67326 RepID=A0ABZ1XKG3_9ACTN|nr:hypothetical protein [Streptomyces melanogenes]